MIANSMEFRYIYDHNEFQFPPKRFQYACYFVKQFLRLWFWNKRFFFCIKWLKSLFRHTAGWTSPLTNKNKKSSLFNIVIRFYITFLWTQIEFWGAQMRHVYENASVFKMQHSQDQRILNTGNTMRYNNIYTHVKGFYSWCTACTLCRQSLDTNWMNYNSQSIGYGNLFTHQMQHHTIGKFN